MKKNEKDGFWKSVVNIVKEVCKLEFKTDSGKINCISMLVLGVLCLGLTTKDWILKGIQLIGGFVIEYNSGLLSQIVYETTDTLKVIIIFVVSFLLCIVTIRVMDQLEKRCNNKKKDGEEGK